MSLQLMREIHALKSWMDRGAISKDSFILNRQMMRERTPLKDVPLTNLT